MKRLAVIVIVSVVSVLLLTHSVVPHHHHAGLPCFHLDYMHLHPNHSKATHPDEDKHGCDNACKQTKQHTNDDESCVLDNLVIIMDNSPKASIHCPIYFHDHSNQLQQANLLDLAYDLLTPVNNFYFRNPPFLISNLSDCTNLKSGLRAPPVA